MLKVLVDGPVVTLAALSLRSFHLLESLAGGQVMSHRILWLNFRTVGDTRKVLGTYFPARSDIILVPFK